MAYIVHSASKQIAVPRTVRLGPRQYRYKATGLPPGLTMDEFGVVTGTLAPGSAGTYEVTITKYADVYHEEDTFTWTINPVVLEAGTISAADIYPSWLYPAGFSNYDRYGLIVGTAAGISTAEAQIDTGRRFLTGTSEGTSTVTGVLSTSAGMVGTSVAGAQVNGSLASNQSSTVGTAAGTSQVNGALASAMADRYTAAGTSSVSGVLAYSQVLASPAQFTYFPVSPSVATFKARRSPSLTVSRRLNEAPDSFSYTSDVAVDTGQKVVAALGDGVPQHFEGPIVRYDQEYEEATDNVVYRTTVMDYQWLLNRRRPFGCFENVSATTVVQTLVADFATGFSAVNVQSGLPAISITFDGSKTFSECLTSICQLLNASWRLDRKVLYLRIDPITSFIAPVDDNNTNLDREVPVRHTKDITQIRNRVFGRGAGVQTTEDTPPGQTFMWVQGADLFTIGGAGGIRASLGGGEMITDCEVFSYTGAEVVYIKQDLPPAPSTNLTASVIPRVVGNIKSRVQYRVSIVRAASGESQLTEPVLAPDYRNFNTIPPVFAGNPSDGHICTGNVEAGERKYAIAWVLSNGDLVMDVTQANATKQITSEGSTIFPVGSIPTVPSSYDGWSPDLRVVAKAMLRTKVGDLTLFYRIEDLPLSQDSYVDRQSDESLGDLAPTGKGLSGAIVNGVSRGGVQNRLTNLPVQDRVALNIYRSDEDPITGVWSDFKRLVTISDTTTVDYIDNATQLFGDPPSAPGPIARMRLYGIPSSGPRSIRNTVRSGTTVRIWAMEEDTEAQLELAQSEGEDGVHEFEVPGLTSITRVADLRARLRAELEIYARPIHTVTFATRDRDNPPKPGYNVHVELSNPPIPPLDLRIQSVDVDQIHEADDLIERYTVVASSVRFTLDDILRRVVIS